MNRIDQLFRNRTKPVLSIYCTAGFPRLGDTLAVLEALQEHGADMIELGIPFSDPLADGPVIQQSSRRALENGMNLALLFGQLAGFRSRIHIPVLFMGYLNMILQFGPEPFLSACAQTGIDGVILPDLPLDEFRREYSEPYRRYGLDAVFLATPETSPERLRLIDETCSGFLYLVSSSSTTGTRKDIGALQDYFRRIGESGLKNPALVGFGIRDRQGFELASRYTRGAVIGTAYIQALEQGPDIDTATRNFLNQILTP